VNEGTVTDDSLTPSAAQPVSWKTTLYKWGMRGLLVVVGLVFALIAIGKVVEFRELPECDSKVARDTLSDVFKKNSVSASKYDFIKTLSKGEENVCTASVSLWKGGHVEVDYRFFWENKEKRWKVTRLEPKN
jgi:hypothetical protein